MHAVATKLSAKELAVSVVACFAAVFLVSPIRHKAGDSAGYQLLWVVANFWVLLRLTSGVSALKMAALCIAIMAIWGHVSSGVCFTISQLWEDRFGWHGLEIRISRGLINWIESDMVVAPLLLWGWLQGVVAAVLMLLVDKLKSRLRAS